VLSSSRNCIAFGSEAKKTAQAPHLIAALKLDQFPAYGPLQPPKHRPEIPDKKRRSADQIRRSGRLVCRSESLPDRMEPQPVVLLTKLEVRDDSVPVVGRTHRSVMIGVFLGEGASTPAFHTRRENSNHINSPTLGLNITIDCLKAPAPKKLTRPGNVLDTAESEVVGRAVFSKGRSGNAKLRIFREFSQQKLEVVGVERDVGIETDDNIVGQMFEARVSGVETIGLASEIPRLPLGHPEQLDPIMLTGVRAHNFISAIRRTITDNQPLYWPNSLIYNGLDREFNERFFITRRRYQEVL